MPLERTVFVLAFVASAIAMDKPRTARAEDPLIFVSAFAGGEDGALHAFRLNLESGKLTPLQKTTDVEHPFFLAVSPDQQTLYSIHARTFGGKENEQVAAYRIQSSNGGLELINRQSANGTAACYLDVDASGRTLLVANYSTGSVAALPIKEGGALGTATSFIQHSGSSVDASRQKEPHAHCIVVSPDNRFAYAADLGLDKILGYRLEPATAKISPNRPAFARTIPGAGPRHLTFHPNGKFVYVINELKNSITAFDYDAESGGLFEVATNSTLPADFEATTHCADLKVTRNGKFLYGTNRGHDSIAAFSIADDGRLKRIGIYPSLGKGPQNLAITAGDEWLLCANMPGNNVVVFRIDPASGELEPVGQPVAMPMPSCIAIIQ